MDDHISSLDKNKLVEQVKKGARLGSLDFYRGIIMVLLMIESTALYDRVINMTPDGSLIHSLAVQFTHHPWHGLHFWDLIQPGFMFIAGVAMAFSLTKQTQRGRSWLSQLKHALRRSWWLLFWGVLDFSVGEEHITILLVDVLAQMAFTLFVAFLIFRWKAGYQILFSVGLLLLTEFLYRGLHISGYDQPFVDQHNFGNYFDMLILGRLTPDGWVTINCIPTAAHTIWGAVAGKWLVSLSDNREKIKRILIFGVIVMVLGLGLDKSGITPIIKRIATSSFTLASGGICLLVLAFLYWWIDLLDHKRFLNFFIIVGMNSLFTYIFFEIPVRHWLFDYNHVIVSDIFSYISSNINAGLIVESVALFALEYSITYWLYKKKIFFKV